MSRGMWFANGSVITGDGVLLVDETFGNRVSAFGIEADGGLANRRTWAQFGEFPTETDQTAALPQIVIAPDGCCLDADGALWIADGLGGRLIRVREGGEIVEEIAVGSGVFACMLGGADGRTLCACAAPDFYEQARRDTREARLLAIRVDVARAGRP
jgi:sugar lactone lactonase YvrE